MHVEYTRRNPRHLGGNPWNDPLEKRRIVHYCWRNEMVSYSLKLSEINYQKKDKTYYYFRYGMQKIVKRLFTYFNEYQITMKWLSFQITIKF